MMWLKYYQDFLLAGILEIQSIAEPRMEQDVLAVIYMIL